MHLAWTSALKKGNFDYYLWLNDDTIIIANALRQMLEYSQTVENKKIIVGATCSRETGLSTYGGFVYPDIKIQPNGNWQDCDFFHGNLVLVPDYIYKKFGILDKHFHHWLGDTDYSMRISKSGIKHALTPAFTGYCEYHESDPVWRNKKVSLFKRIKHFYSPLGNNPFEFFIFEYRHNGLFLAVIRFFSNHIRVLIPQLWKNSDQ